MSDAPNRRLVLDDTAVRRAVRRLAHEIVERAGPLNTVALVGIRTRGLPLARRLAAVVRELRELKKSKSPAAAAGISVDDLLAGAAGVAGTRVIVADARGADAAAMRQWIDQLRRKASPVAVLLGSRDGDKVTLVAGISRELEPQGHSAGEWIKEAATIVGGKGGGRADLAQAGGRLADKLPEALAAALREMERRLAP